MMRTSRRYDGPQAAAAGYGDVWGGMVGLALMLGTDLGIIPLTLRIW